MGFTVTGQAVQAAAWSLPLCVSGFDICVSSDSRAAVQMTARSGIHLSPTSLSYLSSFSLRADFKGRWGSLASSTLELSHVFLTVDHYLISDRQQLTDTTHTRSHAHTSTTHVSAPADIYCALIIRRCSFCSYSVWDGSGAVAAAVSILCYTHVMQTCQTSTDILHLQKLDSSFVKESTNQLSFNGGSHLRAFLQKTGVKKL